MSLLLNFFSNEIAIQTSIYLQHFASIQPRTGLSKFVPKISQKVRKTARQNIVMNPGHGFGASGAAGHLLARCRCVQRSAIIKNIPWKEQSVLYFSCSNFADISVICQKLPTCEISVRCYRRSKKCCKIGRASCRERV